MLPLREFYARLFEPLAREFGTIDTTTVVAVIGFDAGGPLNFSTFGHDRHDRAVTYVSCELAVRPEQVPGPCGRYELLATSGDEIWVRDVVTRIGRMSLEEPFAHHDTLDISQCVPESASVPVYR